MVDGNNALLQRLEHLESRVTAAAVQQQGAEAQAAARPPQQGPTTGDLSFRMENIEQQVLSLADMFNGANAATGEAAARASRAEDALRFLNDRIDSTEGLASTNGDVLNVHETVIVELQGACRDLGQRMSGAESSGDVLMRSSATGLICMWQP